MRCIVEEIFMGWIVEKIIILLQILNYFSLLPSDNEYKLVYIIFICLDSSDIGGRSPNAGMHGIIQLVVLNHAAVHSIIP